MTEPLKGPVPWPAAHALYCSDEFEAAPRAARKQAAPAG